MLHEKTTRAGLNIAAAMVGGVFPAIAHSPDGKTIVEKLRSGKRIEVFIDGIRVALVEVEE